MELLGMERQIDRDIKRIPLKDILGQHRQRWVLHAEIGDIVLKRITYLDSEELTMTLMAEVSGYADALKTASLLSEKLKYGDLDADDMVSLQSIGNFLKQYIRLYYLRCFVEPLITTADELDAILGALNPIERTALLDGLSKLTNPSPGDVSVSGLTIAETNGIPISSDLTLENMTQQQASVLTGKAEKENSNLRELMNGR